MFGHAGCICEGIIRVMYVYVSAKVYRPPGYIHVVYVYSRLVYACGCARVNLHLYVAMAICQASLTVEGTIPDPTSFERSVCYQSSLTPERNRSQL